MRSTWLRSAVLFGATCCALAGAVLPSRAQVPNNPSNAAVAAAMDSTYTPRYRFSPLFTNRMAADVSKVGMGNDFKVGLTTPWGSIFDFGVSVDEKNYRLQAQTESTKLMRLADLHTFSPFWNGTAAYSDSRIFNRTIGVGGIIQDFIINDQALTLGSTYRRTVDVPMRFFELRNLRTDVLGSGGAMNSERAFKTDQSLQAGVNGGVAYDIGDRITVQGRGALRETRDRSETTGASFSGLGSSEDSVMTGLRFQATDSIRFDATYRRYNGDREFTDQARGSLGGQIGGAENVFEETEMRDTRNITLAMTSTITRRWSFNLTGSHDEQVFDYAIQTTRFSRTVGDGVSGSIRYILPWKSISSVQFEHNESLRDLGPTSIGSLNDKRKRVALSLSHVFSKTFSMDFNGSSQIQQTFYLDPVANPRDRDQVDTNLNLRFTSRPYSKISANVTLSYANSEYVNIDATQSRDNRTRELYELRPGFTYFVNPRFTIVQTYGLAIEYSDYVFEETRNFLDRNITFTNEFQYHPTKEIDLSFEYGLHVHDSGSYLPDPDTGEEFLDVQSEDRRDRTAIRVDYRATKNIAFFAENLYSRREDRTPGLDEVDLTTDGQILVGSSALYDWGSGRTLRLSVAKVKRFSPFGGELEKNYWDARSEFAYPF